MANENSNRFKLRPTRPQGPKRGAQPPRLAPSIKMDSVDPTDYLRYEVLSSCEDCSHFDGAAEQCTLGYASGPHRKAEQERTYRLGGRIAFCRFHEID